MWLPHLLTAISSPPEIMWALLTLIVALPNQSPPPLVPPHLFVQMEFVMVLKLMPPVLKIVLSLLLPVPGFKPLVVMYIPIPELI